MENISAYSAYRLRRETVKFLQDMKKAFELSYGMSLSNDEFIRKAFASVEAGDPAVYEIYCRIQLTEDELEQLAKESREMREKK